MCVLSPLCRVAAPKKKAEGLAQVQKGTKVYAADGPVVRSSDPAPAAQDQSIEVDARAEHIHSVNDGPAVTFDNLVPHQGAAEPAEHHEHHEEEAYQEEEQYHEEAPAEHYQEDEGQYDEGY